jgi:predicted HTH transcriptional regulator
MQNLRSRIRGGESATVEFKITVPDKEKLARTIAAFANSAGGTVFVGISDRGDIQGVAEPKAEIDAIERALELVVPRPEVKIEKFVSDLRDIVAVAVSEVEFPDLCYVENFDDDSELLYFRVGAETRPIDRPSERAIIRLRRHSRGDRTVTEEGARLLEYLWDEGAKSETQCAHFLNFSNGRVRKIVEDLIGAGFAIAYDIGRSRAYAAVHPGPGKKARR